MKKYILVLLLITFIVPSVALASWWNPFSWFNNWTFYKTEIAKTETPTIDIDAEIKAKVDAQVKEALKIKAEEDAKIAKQKIDEQKRIDTAVKTALDKQIAQQQSQKITQPPQAPAVSTEKNYYNEALYRIKTLISQENSYKQWLQDTSDQFRSASLTLAGYSTTGVNGQIRDKAIQIANAEVGVISSLMASSNKWSLYAESLRDSFISDPKSFISETMFNKIQTPENQKADIEKAEQDINTSLNNVINSLKYH